MSGQGDAVHLDLLQQLGSDGNLSASSVPRMVENLLHLLAEPNTAVTERATAKSVLSNLAQHYNGQVQRAWFNHLIVVANPCSLGGSRAAFAAEALCTLVPDVAAALETFDEEDEAAVAGAVDTLSKLAQSANPIVVQAIVDSSIINSLVALLAPHQACSTAAASALAALMEHSSNEASRSIADKAVPALVCLLNKSPAQHFPVCVGALTVACRKGCSQLVAGTDGVVTGLVGWLRTSRPTALSAATELLYILCMEPSLAGSIKGRAATKAVRGLVIFLTEGKDSGTLQPALSRARMFYKAACMLLQLLDKKPMLRVLPTLERVLGRLVMLVNSGPLLMGQQQDVVARIQQMRELAATWPAFKKRLQQRQQTLQLAAPGATRGAAAAAVTHPAAASRPAALNNQPRHQQQQQKGAMKHQQQQTRQRPDQQLPVHKQPVHIRWGEEDDQPSSTSSLKRGGEQQEVQQEGSNKKQRTHQQQQQQQQQQHQGAVKHQQATIVQRKDQQRPGHKLPVHRRWKEEDDQPGSSSSLKRGLEQQQAQQEGSGKKHCTRRGSTKQQQCQQPSATGVAAQQPAALMLLRGAAAGADVSEGGSVSGSCAQPVHIKKEDRSSGNKENLAPVGASGLGSKATAKCKPGGSRRAGQHLSIQQQQQQQQEPATTPTARGAAALKAALEAAAGSGSAPARSAAVPAAGSDDDDAAAAAAVGRDPDALVVVQQELEADPCQQQMQYWQLQDAPPPFSPQELKRLMNHYLLPFSLTGDGRVDEHYPQLAPRLHELHAQMAAQQAAAAAARAAGTVAAGSCVAHQAAPTMLNLLRCLELWESRQATEPAMPAMLQREAFTETAPPPLPSSSPPAPPPLPLSPPPPPPMPFSPAPDAAGGEREVVEVQDHSCELAAADTEQQQQQQEQEENGGEQEVVEVQGCTFELAAADTEQQQQQEQQEEENGGEQEVVEVQGCTFELAAADTEQQQQQEQQEEENGGEQEVVEVQGCTCELAAADTEQQQQQEQQEEESIVGDQQGCLAWDTGRLTVLDLLPPPASP